MRRKIIRRGSTRSIARLAASRSRVYILADDAVGNRFADAMGAAAGRPPGIEGLVFRLRGSLCDQAGSDRLGYFFKSTINWELPLL